MKLTKKDKCYVSQYNTKTPYIKLSRLKEVMEELHNKMLNADDLWDEFESSIDELFGEVMK